MPPDGHANFHYKCPLDYKGEDVVMLELCLVPYRDIIQMNDDVMVRKIMVIRSTY